MATGLRDPEKLQVSRWPGGKGLQGSSAELLVPQSAVVPALTFQKLECNHMLLESISVCGHCCYMVIVAIRLGGILYCSVADQFELHVDGYTRWAMQWLDGEFSLL